MLLAIDTATHYLSLALFDGEQLIAEHTWKSENYHTVELAASIATVLDRSKTKPSSLAAICVALGPGSYTGLRIGLAVAKGMALANKTPLIGIPTLDIVAASIGPEDIPLCAVLQAGRRRICAARYNWLDGEWRASGQTANTTWEELLAELDTPTLFAGEIDARALKLLRKSSSNAMTLSSSASLRRAGYLAELGWERFKRNRLDDPATLAPIYLSMPGTVGL